MKRAIRTLLALAAIATLGTTLHAQATSGRISGKVADAQGGLLPGATVTVTEVRTNYSRSTTADATGAYVFVNLPLGTYNATAEMQGFKKELKSGYVLVADGRLTPDFALEVGGLNETVEVMVESETVNTRAATAACAGPPRGGSGRTRRAAVPPRPKRAPRARCAGSRARRRGSGG